MLPTFSPRRSRQAYRPGRLPAKHASATPAGTNGRRNGQPNNYPAQGSNRNWHHPRAKTLSRGVMASAVVFESTAAQAVGPCSLLASVTAPGGRRFVHDNFAKAGTLRLQFLPEPFRHFFNRWVLQSFDVVEISVVQHFQERFHRVANFRVVVNPSGFWIDIAFHGNFDLKTVSMHAPAFMTLRRFRQNLRCFKSK